MPSKTRPDALAPEAPGHAAPADLALFVRVVEAGSFTAAAARLDLPKSSVSRGIAALEQDLNVRLLQRTTRTLHLTDAGQSLYQVASHALEDIERATTCAGELQDLPRGKVRITSPEDVARTCSPGKRSTPGKSR
mgnify:CR=1 FL=1